ncbi:MAG: Carbamoyl-phosphate synthase, large subunit [Parcubacteria group bacterium GW2011_GWC2_49_9]|nr:MAG: Carbamoyl-phosphate synthase, large subunit [Parcubacteria group bacterium GW2011_GWC2_49_9]
MKKSTHIKRVLLLGSGALKIGQAGEFDYSGSQAIKALKAEGVKVVLVNPNVATIQTSTGMADEVYFLPVEPHFVEQVIRKERPDGILLGFGGQTALNCGLELDHTGVFKKYGVQVLGTSVKTIRTTEDRELFANFLAKRSFRVPRSYAVRKVDQAVSAGRLIGYPVMVRSGFSLGGLGSGIMRNERELVEIARSSFSHVSQILIEECLEGWKEIEYEVVRDSADNCITVCNMENLDPLGIHTGESIVVAPSQTLTNEEYHRLRSISIAVIRALDIVGECNIQFALDPKSSEYRIIEVNARLSRSSALASKATGYPLAAVAAHLAVGRTLDELKNSVTKKTPAFFEPALDYLVVKFPRWDFSKFLNADQRIGSQMKSVGEVMAIGRSFPEALQKAVRMLDIGKDGICDFPHRKITPRTAGRPTPHRIFTIAQALWNGATPSAIARATGIDVWFLHHIQEMVHTYGDLRRTTYSSVTPATLRLSKQQGFSDQCLSRIWSVSEGEVRSKRITLGITPVVKRIDTVAAEFPASTNYLYCTYHGSVSDVDRHPRKTAIVLGSGVYRIGSSVEFDWCAVNAAEELHRQGFRSVMVNCNPETVSTDYDMSDALYFEELTLERVQDICDIEMPHGVVVSVGGQIPNTLALALAGSGIKLMGSSASSIDQAEDRHKFSRLLDTLSIDQPPWIEAKSAQSALIFAKKVGYPILVRPSYVLSGSAMNVATDKNGLKSYLEEAVRVSPAHPVVLTKFVTDAHEIDVDAVAQQGRVVSMVISEHVENAGVHSGDATLVLPAQKIYVETEQKIENAVRKIAHALKISGPCNIQFLAQDNAIQVIECNVRASRSFPFASKVTRINLIHLAVRAMLSRRVEPVPYPVIPYVAVKAPQFSFHRLTGTDPILRVEMASTGEVASFGANLHEAFLKSVLATGFNFPRRHILVSLGGERNKMMLLDELRALASHGYTLYATEHTHDFLTARGIGCIRLEKIHVLREPSIATYIADHQLDLVINLAHQFEGDVIRDDYAMRRLAIDYNVPLITNLQLATLFLRAIQNTSLKDLLAKPWSSYLPSEG